MASNQTTTNFRDSNGADLGTRFISKDYLNSVYPNIAEGLGKTPELWVWGSAGQGRLGNANGSTNISTPVTTFSGGSNWKSAANSGILSPFVIKTDGTLWSWGTNITPMSNWSTPSTVFSGGNVWVQCSTSNVYAAAIRSDGTLWLWGNSQDGKFGNGIISGSTSLPSTTFAGGNNWKQVSCGYNHTAAVKTDGTLWIWGKNNFVQLGTNDTTNKSTPVTTFAGGTNWKQVSCGNDSTLAIKTDGTLWAWGQSDRGILGNLQTEPSEYRASTPVTTFVGGTNWKQVSCNLSYRKFAVALKTDGSLWTWGYSRYGNLGRTDGPDYKLTPVTTFTGGTNWANTSTNNPEDLYTIAAGDRYSAAIKTDGTLWLWGQSSYGGGLGNASSISKPSTALTPITTFAGGTNWKQVDLAHNWSGGGAIALKTDGTLWTWGYGGSGRLGNATLTSSSTPVTTFAGGTNWKQVSCGYNMGGAIKTDGTLWTWGGGFFGNLGNASATIVSTPITTFAGGTNWKQLSVGGYGSGAIKTDGTLWIWGRNNRGQLGTNDTTYKSTPVTTFAGGTNWKQVSAGSNNASAIKTDGTLWIWGRNTSGQLGDNTVTNKSTPVTTFAGGTNWKQVSCGGYQTAAIKTDGTLWTWGYNPYGALGTNDTINRSTPVTTFAGGTDWVQVKCGYFYVAALKNNGSLYLFGRNDYSQISLQDSVYPKQVGNSYSWKNASSGGSFATAIKTDGTLWTWGRNQYGQLGNANTTSSFTPITTFIGGTNWISVSALGGSVLAIKKSEDI